MTHSLFFRTPAFSVIIFGSLLFPSLAAAQTQPPVPDLQPDQIRELEARNRIAKRVFRIVREADASFDPSMLFQVNWRARVAERFDQVAEMRTSRYIDSANMEGLQMAGELSFPDEINLTGDTVVIARKVTFRGREVKIKGPFSIHFFVVEPMIYGDGSVGGSIVIDSSGRGRTEWLEEKERRQKNAAGSGAQLHTQDESGAPGMDGTDGQHGVAGQNGPDGSDGADGSCHGSVNGANGDPGADGAYGGDGGDANHGGDGEDGGDITLDIVDVNDATVYTLISKGGSGGRGGAGGHAGPGGIGGKGGSGGKGASCSCAQLGDGGDGGMGGAGSTGGMGGRGGDGGSGGKGGTIRINYPAGYDPYTKITTQTSGGPAGVPGQGGTAGQGGLAGSGGAGGRAGSDGSCQARHGSAGSGIAVGSPGSHGIGGAGGNGGAPGNVYRIQGGGPFNPPPVLQPEYQGSSCWDWVYYTCPCGNYSCCIEINRIPAGCF